MKIIGTGFLAANLQPYAALYDDVVVLAAGVSHPRNPEAAYERERTLVRGVLDDCIREGSKLVFMSSAAIYGGPGCRGREDQPPNPPTDYGRHKAGLERVIAESGVRHLSLRLGYVLGRDAPAHRLVPSLIRQIGEGTVDVHQGASRDLLHVHDMVAIVDALLAVGVEGEVVNIASGRCVPIELIVEYIERRLGRLAYHRVVRDEARHCMSLEKLASMLPPDVVLSFAPTYYRDVIDSYLAEVGLVDPPASLAVAGGLGVRRP